MKLLTLFLGTLLLCSCGSDKYPVSFHMQTGASDSQKFSFRNEDDGYYYSKVPFISQNDIDSYYSFRAADNTYGAVFNIKKGLHSRVEGVTALNLGKQILPIVNGHRMQPMRLYNNPIKGGKLAVLGGFSPADLAAMAEFKLAPVTKPLLPAIDPTKEKKEAKDPEDHKDRTVISTRRGRI